MRGTTAEAKPRQPKANGTDKKKMKRVKTSGKRVVVMICWLLLVMVFGSMAVETKKLEESGKTTKPKPFQWVNEIPEKWAGVPGLKHGTFFSQANNVKTGYCVLLPLAYDDEANKDKRYPVIYYLHGGRPGSEVKSLPLASILQKIMADGQVPPMIYVFSNGGVVSHYDFPEKKSLGETSLIKELIPYIDGHYRTVASRGGRGLEGFSQGGRATGRLMFKYPELFVSAAPMGGGHQHEKDISDTKGHESPNLFFSNWKTNSYDTARVYAAAKDVPKVNIFVAFGTKDFNYEANLEWMKHLDSLGIKYQKTIVPDAPHSSMKVYEKAGIEVMKFHARNFGLLK